jgi:hypothetical protein
MRQERALIHIKYRHNSINNTCRRSTVENAPIINLSLPACLYVYVSIYPFSPFQEGEQAQLLENAVAVWGKNK